jgi:hypothetical protein
MLVARMVIKMHFVVMDVAVGAVDNNEVPNAFVVVKDREMVEPAARFVEHREVGRFDGFAHLADDLIEAAIVKAMKHDVSVVVAILVGVAMVGDFGVVAALVGQRRLRP